MSISADLTTSDIYRQLNDPDHELRRDAIPMMDAICKRAETDPAYKATLHEWLRDGNTVLFRDKLASPFKNADFLEPAGHIHHHYYPFDDFWMSIDSARHTASIEKYLQHIDELETISGYPEDISVEGKKISETDILTTSQFKTIRHFCKRHGLKIIKHPYPSITLFDPMTNTPMIIENNATLLQAIAVFFYQRILTYALNMPLKMAK